MLQRNPRKNVKFFYQSILNKGSKIIIIKCKVKQDAFVPYPVYRQKNKQPKQKHGTDVTAYC